MLSFSLALTEEYKFFFTQEIHIRCLKIRYFFYARNKNQRFEACIFLIFLVFVPFLLLRYLSLNNTVIVLTVA